MTSRTQVLVPIIIAAVIVGVAGLISIPSDSKLESVKFPMGTIKVDGIALQVQVADDQPRRIRGLMFQDSLPSDQGMIFVFDDMLPHSIWMLNMQFALDIIWFDVNGNVVHIEKNVAPCKTALEISACPSYAPTSSALYILEVTSGFVDQNNITLDSVMEIISI